MFEARDKYNKLFNLKSFGASQVDLPTGRFVRVNQAYCTMLGHSEAELLSLTERQVINNYDWQDEQKPYQGYAAPEFQEPMRYRHKSGNYIWLEQTLILYDEACRFTIYKQVNEVVSHTAKLASAGVTEKLNECEHKILRYISQGWSNGAIALELGLSRSMIKHKIRGIYHKLGVTSWTEAVAWAHKGQASEDGGQDQPRVDDA